MVKAQTNRHTQKVCGYCGKKEQGHWSRHFDRKHNSAPQIEWNGLSSLKADGLFSQNRAWCENWQQVITENAKPINVRAEFRSGGISTHISKGKTIIKKIKPKQTKYKVQLMKNASNHEGLHQDAQQQATQNDGNLLQKRAFNGISTLKLKTNKQINKNGGINLRNKRKSDKVDDLDSQPLLQEAEGAMQNDAVLHHDIFKNVSNAEEVVEQTVLGAIDELMEEQQNNIEITVNPVIGQQFSEIAVLGSQKANQNIWDNCFNDLQQVQHINIGYLNTSIASDNQQIPAKSTPNPEFNDQLDNLPQIMPVKSAQNDLKDKLIQMLLGQTNYTFDKIMTWDFANKTIDSYLQIRFDMRQITLEELEQPGINYKYEFAQSNLTPQCKIFANDLLLVAFKDVSTLDHQQISLNLCKAVLPRQDILKAFTQEMGKYLVFKKIQLLITNDVTLQFGLLSMLDELVVSTKTEPQLVSQVIFEDQVIDILNKSAPTNEKKQQIQLQQLQDTLDLQNNKLKELQGKLIVAIEDNSFSKHRYGLQMQIDTNKRSFKELCPDENSSEFNVSSLHSSQVVNLYRDNIFPNSDDFQEGYITADYEDVSKYKQQAYEDKILIRANQRWENKMQKFKQTQQNLEQLVKQKTKQIAELELLLTSRLNEMQSQIDQQNQTIKDQHTQLEQLRIGNINPSIACSVTEASTNVVPFVIDAEQQLLHMGYYNVQLIGQGGFGVVFKACKDQKLVAIKIPIRLDCKNEIILMKKIQSTGYLNRQFVVPIIAEIWILKRPSFVMNYYEKTLADFINENHSMKQIKLIFYFILRGISAAHTHYPVITHRDIKPANILLNSFMSPLIADWGLASQDSHQFTGGTCSYMDPRIWHQAKSTPQNLMQSHYGIKPQKSIIDYKSADVWSLGIVLYLMIEKKHPFTKDQITSWRDLPTDIEIPLSFTIADNKSQIFITSMLQLDQRKRPSVVQLLQNSVFAEVIKGIEMFTDPIDLRSYFRNECVQSNVPQVLTTFTEKSKAGPAQETISYQNQISSVCSISTLRHPSDIWHQEELNVQSILNAVNEDSLLKFFKQQNKVSASVKDIWKYFSHIVAGKVLDFIKVSDFIERIKITKSLKLNLREYSPYNADQSILTLRQEPTNTNIQESLTQINSGILNFDLSLSIDSSDSSDDLISIDSLEFYNIRKETLTEFTQIQGIIARTAKYIQQIEHNEELDNAINSNNTSINDKKHVIVGQSLPVTIIDVVDMSLKNQDTIIEHPQNADQWSRPPANDALVDSNLCVTKKEAKVVVTSTILGKRRHQFQEPEIVLSNSKPNCTIQIEQNQELTCKRANKQEIKRIEKTAKQQGRANRDDCMDMFAAYYKENFTGMKFIDFKKIQTHPQLIIDVLQDDVSSNTAHKYVANQRNKLGRT